MPKIPLEIEVNIPEGISLVTRMRKVAPYHIEPVYSTTPPDPPKLESRADLHQTETQLEKEGLAAGSGESVCTHCGTGQHPNPLWRNSRASLDEYRTTDTICNEFSGDVWLHANCIAEFMREHPALALSIPT